MAATKKTKKLKARKPRTVSIPAPLTELQKRVAKLEGDMGGLQREVSGLKETVSELSEELASLNSVTAQVNERTLRTEHVMLAVQGEQRRTSRVIDRIAEHFNLKPEPTIAPSAEPAIDELPPEADEPE